MNELIRIPDMQGCTSDVKRFLLDAGDSDNILWSPKIDGVRTMAMVFEDGGVTYLSRARTEFQNFGKFSPALTQAANELAAAGNGWPVVFDGEVVPKSGGGLSKVMTQLRRLEEVDDSDLRYVVFDAIVDGITQIQRLEMLSFVLPYDGEDVQLLFHHNGRLDCRDERVIALLMEHLVRQGYEGAVLKMANAPYAATPSGKYWLKVKPVETLDLPVVGWTKGLGKHSARLGALICLLPNGKRVGVGTGFYDADRERIARRTSVDPEVWEVNLPSVIEVRYQELNESGVPRFPAFVQERRDKEVAS